MAPPSPTYSIEDLCAAARVTRRTIRSWIAKGLLPAPKLRGPRTRYTAEHRDRAVAIARLRQKRVPLDAIPRRLAAETAAAKNPIPETVRLPPAPTYPAQPWERVVLVPGLELHVNPTGGPLLRRLAQAIYDWFGPGGGAGLPPRT